MESHNATESHDLYRNRRKPLDVFLSQQSIQRIEGMIADEIKAVKKRLSALKGTGQVMNLEYAYASITGDIIGQICSEESISLVNGPDFSSHWYNLIFTCISQAPLFLHIPWVVEYVPRTPP